MCRNGTFVIISANNVNRTSSNDNGVSSCVSRRSRATVRRTSVVIFIISTQTKVVNTSTRVNGFLRALNGPICIITGGISNIRSSTPTRFCTLKLNRPCPVTTDRNHNVNGLLRVLATSVPRRSTIMRPENLGLTVVNHPGIKGSALIGHLLNRSHIIIFSVPNAAHSDVCVPCGHSNGSCMLVSATNIHHHNGVSRGMRGFSIVGALRTVRSSGIAIVIVSTRRKVISRSLRVVNCTLSTNHTLIMTVGG